MRAFRSCSNALNLWQHPTDERGVTVPKNCIWDSLKDKSGTALTDHYADILRKLREGGGLLGDIFAQSVPRFNNPVNSSASSS